MNAFESSDTYMDNIDTMEDPENYTENEERIENNPETDDLVTSNADEAKAPTSTVTSTKDDHLYRLPLSRVKNIIKLDPDSTVVSLETVFLVTKATELFVQSLAREAFVHTHQKDKKTIQKQDLDAAIESVDALHFLEETL